MAHGKDGIAALFQNEAILTTPFTATAIVDAFPVFDLQPTVPVTIPVEPGNMLPFHLRFDNGWKVSNGATLESLAEMFAFDLHGRTPSGMYSLGNNNMEGRVAWSQVYYLNGLIDLVKAWDNEGVNFDFLGDVKRDVKLRLDLEMYLLDRLLDTGNPGLVSRRYTIDRIPATFAVHSGRVLRLLYRYRFETANSLPLANYERIAFETQTLQNHIEVLVSAVEGYPDTIPGQQFLQWPKGADFWLDGIAVAYNMQNAWADGIAYAARENAGESSQIDAAKDIIELFATNEGFYSDLPSDYQWRLFWGWMRTGWTRTDEVSVNTPDYSGHTGLADISYRVIDVMAILSVGQISADVLPDGFVAFAKKAVEENGVFPFATEELLNFGAYPALSPELATLYVRVKSPWELQSSTWALLSLRQHIVDGVHHD